MGFTAYRKAAALLLAFSLLGRGFALSAAAEGQTLADRVGAETTGGVTEDALPYYSQVKGGYTVRPAGVRVCAAGESYTAWDGEKPAISEKGGVYTDESTASLTWTVEAPEAGAYHIEVTYRTVPGAAVSPQRELLINGKQTYTEEGVLAFERKWQDAADPVRNRLGDDVRPDQKELDVRSVKHLTDQWGKDAEPLLFPFEKGANTITLRYINQPLIIEEVAVVSYQAGSRLRRGARRLCPPGGNAVPALRGRGSAAYRLPQRRHRLHRLRRRPAAHPLFRRQYPAEHPGRLFLPQGRAGGLLGIRSPRGGAVRHQPAGTAELQRRPARLPHDKGQRRGTLPGNARLRAAL